MVPLMLSLMSLLSQRPRTFFQDPRSGRALYDNPSQPAFDNNIWSRNHPTIIKVDSFEPQRVSPLANNFNPKIASIMVVPIMTNSLLPIEKKPEIQQSSLVNPDVLKLLLGNIPMPMSQVNFQEPKPFDLKGNFNPDIVRMVIDEPLVMQPRESREFPQVRSFINPEEIQSIRIPETRDLPISNDYFIPELLQTIVDTRSKMPQPSIPESREMSDIKSIYNQEMLPLMFNILPTSPRPVPTTDNMEIPGQSAHLLKMLLDSSNVPASQLSQDMPNNFVSPLSDENAMLDFPILNFGNPSDSLPMAISHQPSIVPTTTLPEPTLTPRPIMPFDNEKPNMNITEITLCENSMITLSCPIAQSLYFVNIFYGRASKEICNPVGSILSPQAYNSTSCALPSSMATILDLCENQNTCKLIANNEVFREDPCPGIEKYMQMSYYCH